MKKAFFTYFLTLIVGVGALSSLHANSYNSAYRLADKGIITYQKDFQKFRVDDSILRQELIGIAIQTAGVDLPPSYTCNDYYADVGTFTPNSWACRSIELAADNGLITRANATFRPEDDITKSEALAILMQTQAFRGHESLNYAIDPEANTWQTQVLKQATYHGIIANSAYFGVNDPASRGEIFGWADKILHPEYRLSNVISETQLFSAQNATPDIHTQLHETITLLNGERRGLQGLEIDSDLSHMAQDFADYMCHIQKLTHYGPNGEDVSDRAISYGYDFKGIGENVGFGYSESSHIVQAFMASKGHRENIMNPEYNRFGLGYCKSYWTFLFAKQ